MDNSEFNSDKIGVGNQLSQVPSANHGVLSPNQRKSRAVAATPQATRASRRRRTYSWASRQR